MFHGDHMESLTTISIILTTISESDFCLSRLTGPLATKQQVQTPNRLHLVKYRFIRGIERPITATDGVGALNSQRPAGHDR